MILIKTIEIDEIDTDVKIDFNVQFGDVEIHQITDLMTGDAIDVKLSDALTNELAEYAADYIAEKRSGSFGTYTRYNYDY